MALIAPKLHLTSIMAALHPTRRPAGRQRAAATRMSVPQQVLRRMPGFLTGNGCVVIAGRACGAAIQGRPGLWLQLLACRAEAGSH